MSRSDAQQRRSALCVCGRVMPGAAPLRRPGWLRGLAGSGVVLLAASGLVLWRAQMDTLAAFRAGDSDMPTHEVRAAEPALRAAAAAAGDAERARPDGWTQRVALPGHVVLQPDASNASRALLLVDLVLVPKHGHIMASVISAEVFQAQRNETRTQRALGPLGRWAGPGYWEWLARVCDALPALELAVGSRVLHSRPCVPLKTRDPNLKALSLGKFPLTAETREALRAELAARGPRAEIAVRLNADGLYATIDPVSRAAGLFHRVRRPSTGREDEDLARAAAWADPLGPEGANPPEQLSVCLKNIHDSNPFMEDLVAHHEAQGVAHLYLSVTGPEIEREMTERLARWIAAGFLTLVQLDVLFPFVIPEGFQGEESFWGDLVKTLFLNSCLHHAKQVDALVGAWDIDEFVSIHDPACSDPHLGRYIVSHFARWAPAAGHKLRLAGPEELLPAPPGDPVAAANALLEVLERANSTAQPVLPLLWYCEFSLSKFENHAPRSQCNWSAFPDASQRPERASAIAARFPLRAEEPTYGIVKGVVIAANVQVLETHTHNFQCEPNLLVRDSDRTAAVRVVRASEDGIMSVQRRRSIFPPIGDVGVHHFSDMYTTRRMPNKTYVLSEFATSLPQSLLRSKSEVDNVQRAAQSINCSNSRNSG